MPRILTPKPLSSKIVRPSYKDAPGESSVYDEIWVREPRLMVPGMQPLGPVKISSQHKWVDGALIRGNVRLGQTTSFTDAIAPSVATTSKGVGRGTSAYNNYIQVGIQSSQIRTLISQFIVGYVGNDSTNNYYNKFLAGGSPVSSAYTKLQNNGTVYGGGHYGKVALAATEGSSPYTAFSLISHQVTANEVHTAVATLTGPWQADTAYLAVDGILYSSARNLKAPYTDTVMYCGNCSSVATPNNWILLEAWSRSEIPPSLVTNLSLDPWLIVEPA